MKNIKQIKVLLERSRKTDRYLVKQLVGTVSVIGVDDVAAHECRVNDYISEKVAKSLAEAPGYLVTIK